MWYNLVLALSKSQKKHNNNTESMQLAITGTVYRSEDRLDFNFFDEEKEIGLDYFKSV